MRADEIDIRMPSMMAAAMEQSRVKFLHAWAAEARQAQWEDMQRKAAGKPILLGRAG